MSIEQTVAELQKKWDLVPQYSCSQGLLLILSGPGAAGKDTLVRILKKTYTNLHYTVTVTSRPARVGEIDWEHYHFVSSDEFEQLIEQGHFLEWVRYFDHYYGTPKDQVQQALDRGKDVILKIETQGARTVREVVPHAVYVFMTTGSADELAERLKYRGDLDPERQEKRLKIAIEEMACLPEYDYLIINSNEEAFLAAEKLKAIIEGERNRIGRKPIVL
jgi:guanylate kinase